jgi:hypothetical protein
MARSVARAGLIRPDPYRVSSAVEHREAMCIGCTIGKALTFVDGIVQELLNIRRLYPCRPGSHVTPVSAFGL